MNESAGTPLPMNSTPSHAKLKLSLSFSDRTFIAGEHVCGALEMSSHGGGPGERGKELGIGSMVVEMWGVEELLSRDHTAKAPFLYCRRLFQGPGLPPSNAVHAHPLPNMQPLPAHYYLAKKGQSSFNFRMPVPATSPSSILFANAARVRYEVRASVQVFWKGEKKVVVQSKEVDVVESYADVDFSRDEPEAVAVGENGKIWMQGRLIGGVLVAGESACIELQVKNHSSRKNTSLSLSLTRTLHVTNAPDALLISDTLATHPFRGPDFIIPPGAEGVASLVFDVPRNARSVRGGVLEGLEGSKGTHALFDIKATVTVKMAMGMGRNDIVVEIPVIIVHPSVLPELPPPEEEYYPPPQEYYDPRAQSPFDPRASISATVLPSMSPPIAYVDPAQNLVWLPPPAPQYPVHTGQPYYFPLPQPQHYNPEAVALQSPSISPQYHHPTSPVEHHPLPSGLPVQMSPSGLPPPIPIRNPLPPQPTTSTAPPPLKIDLQNLAPQNLSPHATSPQGVVYSPRPFLSPKLTPTSDPMNASLGRSERVEELERMADEEEKQTIAEKEELHEVKASEAPVAMDKTLPGPPVPSGKVSTTQSRPRADLYFSEPKATPQSEDSKPRSALSTSQPPPSPEIPKPVSPTHEQPKPIDVPIAKEETAADGFQTPPTPTLTAVAHPSSKKPAQTFKKPPATLKPHTENTESGLDALERRLLAEVGTRKIRDRVDAPSSIMALGFHNSATKAIDIPSPRSKDSKEEGDSAISSLSLGAEDEEREWDERTHRGGAKKSHDGGKSNAETAKSKSNNEGKSKRGSDRKEAREGKSKRKLENSKGRVAEWLGGVPTGVEDVDEGLPYIADKTTPSPSPTAPVALVSEPTIVDVTQPEVTKFVNSSVNANAKVIEPPAAESKEEEEEKVPHPRSSGFMPIGTFKRDAYTRTLIPKDANPWADEPIRLKSVPLGPEQTNPWKHVKKAPGLPSFQLPSRPTDPEVKYDVRSARGGRGGKVTAVAAIFAAGKSEDSTPPTSSPLAKAKASPVSTSKPPRLPYNIGKSKTPVSSSVAVSSSHATPTLSSTASLARPATNRTAAPGQATKGWKPVMTAVSETLQDGTKSPTPKVSPGYVFGQAKLKDLINKYQHP
ncbi:hypothetical protein BDZ89DRAFT_1065634 [Hymenopellis radicata]|nr:hypothetical protein BDZ89DRAFT_1065634 [Hymenopellis radicata]